MNRMRENRAAEKASASLSPLWIPAAFAAGTLLGMAAMAFLAANFTEAYNPARRKRHRKKEEDRDSEGSGRYASGA